MLALKRHSFGISPFNSSNLGCSVVFVLRFVVLMLQFMLHICYVIWDNVTNPVNSKNLTTQAVL